MNSGILYDSFKVAYEVIDEILNEGAELLYSEYISEKSVPYGIKTTIELLFSVIEWSKLRHEQEVVFDWTEDLEPSPCSVDTWARNAIPSQKKFKIITPEVLPILADNKSMKSYRSARSARTIIGKHAKVQKPGKTSKETESITEVPQPFPIIQDKMMITEEEEVLRRKKENESRKKTEENDRMQKLKEELDEKEKKLKKEISEMKKKNFTYDNHGNILYVNQLKYDQIPKIFVEVDYKSNQLVKEGNTLPVTAQKKRHHIEDASRLKTAPTRDQEWVKNITSVQPSLFDTINLNAGVILIEGTKTKYPPTMHSSSHKTLTKREYNVQTLGIPRNNTSNLPMDKKSSHLSSQDSFRKASRISSRRDVIEEIPDFDVLGDVIEEPHPSALPVNNDKKNGKITIFGTNENNGNSELHKFNSEIMKNKNWGNNPSMKKPVVPDRLPKRPSSKDLIEIYGDIMKKPKDQPFITTKELWNMKGEKLKKPKERAFIEKIEKKTRMPAPRFGLTMINALPDYEEKPRNGTQMEQYQIKIRSP